MRLGRVWFAAGCVGLAALAVPAARSGAAPGADDRARELQEAIGDASAEEAAALAALGEIRARRAGLDAAVVALDAEVATVEQRAAAARTEVDRLDAAAVELARELDEVEARLRAAEERFGASAVELYRTGDASARAATLLLDARTPQELSAGTVYLRVVTSDRQDDVDVIADLRADVDTLRDAVGEQQAQARAAQATAEEELTRLAGLRDEQARRRDEIAAEERREHELLDSIRARKDAFTAELAALQSTSNSITDLLRSRQAGQPPAATLSLVRPVPGEITSEFGVRVHPILGTTRMHNGIDMDADHGTPIVAAADGIVAWSGPRDGYGNTVIVDHGNRYATLYAHASSLLVSDGEPVDAGETIALVGSTGLSSGPHLHFELRRLGVPVDPVPYL